ncbi:hypothetical protein R1sor_000131 [Riccia sorocarpa]|uniref:Uncharacterized protein n=1 Tax=Riccia sorocarpa TaxID=122646 RepID=A0ABD3GUR7_9MARC
MTPQQGAFMDDIPSHGVWEFVGPIYSLAMQGCWSAGGFPKEFFEGVVTVVPKDSNAETLSGWRQITLLSSLYKVEGSADAGRFQRIRLRGITDLLPIASAFTDDMAFLLPTNQNAFDYIFDMLESFRLTSGCKTILAYALALVRFWLVYLRRLERLFAAFLWDHVLNGRAKTALAAWSRVALPTELGGGIFTDAGHCISEFPWDCASFVALRFRSKRSCIPTHRILEQTVREIDALPTLGCSAATLRISLNAKERVQGWLFTCNQQQRRLELIWTAQLSLAVEEPRRMTANELGSPLEETSTSDDLSSRTEQTSTQSAAASILTAVDSRTDFSPGADRQG